MENILIPINKKNKTIINNKNNHHKYVINKINNKNENINDNYKRVNSSNENSGNINIQTIKTKESNNLNEIEDLINNNTENEKVPLDNLKRKRGKIILKNIKKRARIIKLN